MRRNINPNQISLFDAGEYGSFFERERERERERVEPAEPLVIMLSIISFL
jgi:hypothetical protein